MSSTTVASSVPSRSGSSRAGQRRRAAAEQRRIDQQRWGQYLGEDDEEEEVAVLPTGRSRSRRSARRLSARDSFDDRLASEVDDEFGFAHPRPTNDVELDVALALSLSLFSAAPATTGSARVNRERVLGGTITDMSYENLVMLEDVRTVASSAAVDALVVHSFLASDEPEVADPSSEVCCICQHKYENEEEVMILPCNHSLHHSCGSEWLLNYSKLCPVCKCSITE